MSPRTVSVLFFVWMSSLGAAAQRATVPPPAQQIAAAVLPLPEPMRSAAGVIGYAPDLSLVTLRPSTNGMVCLGAQPSAKELDVRCYHESFLPLVRRVRELHEKKLPGKEVGRTIDAEVKSGKLILPDRPTAGYRMLGPSTSYNPQTNTVGKEIYSWQSIHFPYKTAAELGLPEEGTVPRTQPYVMASGTFWSHVMIEHEPIPEAGK
jgi:hypothetical protein